MLENVFIKIISHKNVFILLFGGTTCINIIVFFRPVSIVRLKDTVIDQAGVGQVFIAEHNGETVYKALLSFKNNMNGEFDVCLEAEDELGSVLT